MKPEEIRDKVKVRLDFSLEEARALDFGIAGTLESKKMLSGIYNSNDELIGYARKGAMRLRQALTRALDPEYDREKKDEYVQRMQALTGNRAKNTWKPWTEQEKAYLLESDEPLVDIAIALGRTFRGVKEMRKKLSRRRRSAARKPKTG